MKYHTGFIEINEKRIFFYDKQMNLKMYFNMWKINDVLDHIKGHVTLTIENVFKVFMYFKNINLKNKMTGKLD